MNKGKILSINITPEEGTALSQVQEIRAVVGKGLEGDRYFFKTGKFSSKPSSGREVTLIESEAILAAQRDYRIVLKENETRRTLVTENIALSHLVGKEFFVGEVLLKGIRLCEPCGYLESLTKVGVKAAYIHRGGLRADILKEGMIRVGDEILMSS